MLKKILFICIIILALVGWIYASNPNALKISLTTAKNSHDKVILNLYISNRSTEPVDIYQYSKSLEPVLGYYLNFDIYHKEEKLELSYDKARVKFPFKNDFITLNPNDTYTERIEISNYYNLKGSKEDEPWAEGEYMIICSYEYKYEGTKYGANLWEGTVISDTLRLVVK